MKKRLLVFATAFVGFSNLSTAQSFNTGWEVYPGPQSSEFTSPVEFQNKLFIAGITNTKNGIWTSDGSTTLSLLKEFEVTSSSSSRVSDLTVVNNTLFFVAKDTDGKGRELYKTDGTLAGTVLVKDINLTSNGAGSGAPTLLTNVNGTLYFVANDGVNGKELWKSDGTDAGTVMVKDIYPGITSSSPLSLLNINGLLYFTADDGISGKELWKSDGTDAGTVMVKDINSGTIGSSPINLSIFNNEVYFSADGGGSKGFELWKSDGTDAGTVLVKDIYVGSSSSNPSSFTVVNGTLFFTAEAASLGRELWRSNGTAAGTVIVKDLNSGTSSSSPFNLCAVGNKLYFSCNTFILGGFTDLYVSNGTSSGTTLFAPTNYDITTINNINGLLIYSARIDGGNGDHLIYAYNGKAFTEIPGCTDPTLLVKAGSKLYALGDGRVNSILRDKELFMTEACPKPAAPALIEAKVCQGGAVTLSVTGNKGNASFYTAALGGTFLGAEPFTTGMINSAVTYYSQDSICGASDRSQVNITVYTSIPAPSNITAPANLKICKNASTKIKTNFLGTIKWYTAPTGGTLLFTGVEFTTPSLTQTTTYYAEDNLCNLASPRTPITVTISNINGVISSISNVACTGQSNGSATISVTGGFGGNTFSWSPSGGAAATATGLAQGTYVCTVKDISNCIDTVQVKITQPTVLIASLNAQNNVKCNGETNGSATVAGSGGTAPYTYLWSNGGETTSSITNKGVGTYTCTVKDAKLCTQTKSVMITQPNALSSVISAKTDLVCNGAATGTATITVAGGTTPYTYAWDNGAGTSKTITNRPAGTYTCTIKDKNECEKTQQVVLVEPSAIIPSISSQTNPTCFGESSGSATVTATGGTPGYTYSWSPGGETGATITNKADGTYTCTIKDSKQCTKTQEVVLVQPPFINRGITITLGGTKFTVDEVDATYQWFNCDNNQQIPGANQRSYVSTTSSGRFKVRITKNGCTVESACVDMNSAGIDDMQVNVMEVYPNPSTGEFTIEIPFSATVKITNMLGQEVYFNSVVNGKTLINLSGLAKGVYNIKATSEEGENYLERVVID